MAAIENPLFVKYEATCTYCGWKKIFEQASSSGLELGSIVGRGDDLNYNRCNRCKRYNTLQITKIPETTVVTKPVGFWKIPEE
jgi:hypothetical protein